MKYGTLAGGLGGLTFTGLPTGYSAAFFASSGVVHVSIGTGPQTIDWTGQATSAWNTTDGNWTVSGTTTTYGDNDSVVFNDSGNGNVNIAVTVQPGQITVSNTSTPYTISGSGTIAGSTSLVKQGPGMLTITMSTNTYTGGTMLDAGMLQIGASSTSGGSVASGPLGIGLVTLSGGTLQDDGNGQTLANAISVNGNVTLGSAGAKGLTFSGSNTVAITGSPVITVTAPTTIADQITGGTLVLAGTGTLILGGANVYTGPTAVTAGTLQLGPSPLATAPLSITPSIISPAARRCRPAPPPLPITAASAVLTQLWGPAREAGSPPAASARE